MARERYQPVPQFEAEPVNNDIANDLHVNEAQINPTLKKPFVQPPPDPRDPQFEPRLEERAERIIAAGLMAPQINPCTAHLEILRVAFPEWEQSDYPRLTVKLWFAIKDWKWLKLQQAGIREDTSMLDVTSFDTSTLGEIYAAIGRIQTAAVKYINLHNVAVPQDPRFNARAELRVRVL